jgi:hypothetical protein
MPRPKGSKKDKNQSTSSSSPLSSLQTSILLSNIDCSNEIKTSMNNSIIHKVGRPKKIEFLNTNDDSIITINSPTSSSSEISGGRVVVNPAVLRYLEQNRNYSLITNQTEEFFDKSTPMEIIEENDENSFDDLLKSLAVQESIILSNEQCISINELIEFDELIQDNLFWDFSTYSTEFLTSTQLAEWILSYQQSVKLIN